MEDVNDLSAGDDGKSARKRLIKDDGTINVRGQTVPNLVGKVSNTVLLLENGVLAGGTRIYTP